MVSFIVTVFFTLFVVAAIVYDMTEMDHRYFLLVAFWCTVLFAILLLAIVIVAAFTI